MQVSPKRKKLFVFSIPLSGAVITRMIAFRYPALSFIARDLKTVLWRNGHELFEFTPEP
jgi:hypothetical protein